MEKRISIALIVLITAVFIFPGLVLLENPFQFYHFSTKEAANIGAFLGGVITPILTFSTIILLILNYFELKNSNSLLDTQISLLDKQIKSSELKEAFSEVKLALLYSYDYFGKFKVDIDNIINAHYDSQVKVQTSQKFEDLLRHLISLDVALNYMHLIKKNKLEESVYCDMGLIIFERTYLPLLTDIIKTSENLTNDMRYENKDDVKKTIDLMRELKIQYDETRGSR